jgi:hypothetical protein
MTVEFVSVNPSSNVHIGSHVPLGGIPEYIINDMVNIKTMLFLLSAVVQLAMYVCIFCKIVPMPEGEDEDLICKNEVMLFFYGNKSYAQQQQASDDGADLDDITLATEENFSANSLTLAYVENMYIIFWVSKDLFWSWGTGDLFNGFKLAIFYEAAAMCFATLSLFVHLITAYIYRRNTLLLLDCITTILWISANFVWMCGEFFLRYDNLAHDDGDEGNDSGTRIVSAALFALGLTIQVYILISFAMHRRVVSWKARRPQVEMAKLPMSYQSILIAFSPQHERQQGDDDGDGDDDDDDGDDDRSHRRAVDDEEESTVLF